MSEAAAEKTLEGLATAKVDQYLKAMEQLAQQYAPDVVDASLTVVRVSGIQSLVAGTLGLLAFIAGCAWMWRLYKNRNSYGDPGPFIIPAIFLTGLGAVFTGLNLLSVWTWVAVIDPKLYIAYRVFQRLL